MTSHLTITPNVLPATEDAASADDPSRKGTDISVEDERWISVEGFETLIPKLVAEALREAGLDPEISSVSIALLSGAAVRTLNKSFRGKDYETNVLSFPSALHSPDDAGFLGDIALSYDTVISEAQAQQKTPLDHAAHLVVHGVLHLAGFDHEQDEEAERMEAAERSILARFNISDPYRDDTLALTS